MQLDFSEYRGVREGNALDGKGSAAATVDAEEATCTRKVGFLDIQSCCRDWYPTSILLSRSAVLSVFED